MFVRRLATRGAGGLRLLDGVSRGLGSSWGVSGRSWVRGWAAAAAEELEEALDDAELVGGRPTPSSTSTSGSSNEYDIVIIGSGPAGQKCAIASAKKGKKVAIVDASATLGGVCTHTGTLPSKTVREALLHLTGYRHQAFYSPSQQLKKVTISDVMHRVTSVIGREQAIIRDQLFRNGVEIIPGHASFEDANTISIGTPWSDLNKDTAGVERQVTSDYFLVSTGTRPARPDHIPFEAVQVFDSDEMLAPDWEIPRTLIVVGAGVIGLEYASMMNIIPGSRVVILDQRPTGILPFADQECTDALCHLMRQEGARFMLGETIKECEVVTDQRGKETVIVELDSGKVIYGDALLYAVGRQANTDKLNLEGVGIETNRRGLISVDENFQAAPTIFAAGDVIGYPALASTSMEQGRMVADFMFEGKTSNQLEFFPYGIYTVPEISMVGKTEKELTAEGVAYEVGQARFSELAKGAMLGNTFGFLKLVFCPNTRKLFGISAIGESSIELVHTGQAVMALGGTIDYFLNTVFNYPSFGEAYKVAALQGMGKLKRVRLANKLRGR